MIYPYNNQKPDILIDGTPDMRLANILAIMDRETFGQRKAASMVGGLGRLLKQLTSKMESGTAMQQMS